MQFSPSSRVWVYQSTRAFTATEIAELNTLLTEFTQQWTAHNQQLHAGFELQYNRFIVLKVDESNAGASGCSIDKSVHLMQQLEKQFNIQLFDRWNIAYKKGEEVQACNREEFEQLISMGTVHADTIVFNNLVQTLDEYTSKWEIKAKESWHRQVFDIA